MKKAFPLLLSLLVLFSCGSDESGQAATASPEGDVDAARMFIRTALDGKWKDARRLIVQDSANLEWLAAAERAYTRDSVTNQRGLRESSINLHDTQRLNDSTTVVEYSNSFRNKKQPMKVVRQDGYWLVDLKYTFQNKDSSAK